MLHPLCGLYYPAYMNSQHPQRWLSMTGICTTLGIDEDSIRGLVKEGFLVRIGGGRASSRYLDPTPEYAERLRLAHLYHIQKLTEVPDLPAKALISCAELSQLAGWSEQYTWKYISKHKVPKIKMGRYTLFTVETVRDILWKRGGRKIAAAKNPFLLADLVEWFKLYQASEDADVPTDADIAADERFQRKMVRIAKMPSLQRDAAMVDLLQKVELAKTISHREALHSDGSDTHQPSPLA